MCEVAVSSWSYIFVSIFFVTFFVGRRALAAAARLGPGSQGFARAGHGPAAPSPAPPPHRAAPQPPPRSPPRRAHPGTLGTRSAQGPDSVSASHPSPGRSKPLPPPPPLPSGQKLARLGQRPHRARRPVGRGCRPRAALRASLRLSPQTWRLRLRAPAPRSGPGPCPGRLARSASAPAAPRLSAPLPPRSSPRWWLLFITSGSLRPRTAGLPP